MWPLLFCSLVTVAIAMERFFVFQGAKVNTSNLLTRVKKMIAEESFEKAERMCRKTRGPVANVIAVTLHVRGRQVAEKEKIVSLAGSREIRGIGRRVRLLGIIAHVSPLLGLLGTVTGMIRAFREIQGLGGQVDASVLAGGIWEALITTATGLAIAIPAMLAYHYFEGEIERFTSEMKEAIQQVFEWTDADEAGK
ncbi:MAG: MotA/TolQ/ExbB proton channel family protein [Candidatus Omnitrophica bacterium]|nr:MotA/TolQ/ExbB proton channel family protein [Candidatus Omnitrophota bacterium]